jgi:NADH-quinone oxidoreductase subunit N
MWTPDVYEGAPSPVTAFMSVGAKAGGFAALLRVLAAGLPAFVIADGQAAAWQTITWVVAAATLIVGNLVAIAQTNVKRMLAYSSIAHAGYILMAVAAAGTAGVADSAARGALFYLIAYMFTNLGAFAVAMALERNDGSGTEMNSFVGLAKSRPGLAVMMAIFMLSLAGIPGTAGFFGKVFVFLPAWDAGLTALVIVGAITSAISAYYYLMIVVNMFLKDGNGDSAEGATPYLRWVIYAACAGTVLLGILPWLATDLTSNVTLAASILP